MTQVIVNKCKNFDASQEFYKKINTVASDAKTIEFVGAPSCAECKDYNQNSGLPCCVVFNPKQYQVGRFKNMRLASLRCAKKIGRLRRWNNWKKMAAERARFYNLPLAEKYRYLITHAVDTVKKGMIDTVQDCVGIIKGMEWGGYRNE